MKISAQYEKLGILHSRINTRHDYQSSYFTLFSDLVQCFENATAGGRSPGLWAGPRCNICVTGLRDLPQVSSCISSSGFGISWPWYPCCPMPHPITAVYSAGLSLLIDNSQLLPKEGEAGHLKQGHLEGGWGMMGVGGRLGGDGGVGWEVGCHKCQHQELEPLPSHQAQWLVGPGRTPRDIPQLDRWGQSTTHTPNTGAWWVADCYWDSWLWGCGVMFCVKFILFFIFIF